MSIRHRIWPPGLFNLSLLLSLTPYLPCTTGQTPISFQGILQVERYPIGVWVLADPPVLAPFLEGFGIITLAGVCPPYHGYLAELIFAVTPANSAKKEAILAGPRWSTQLLGPRSSVFAKGHVCDRLVTAFLYGFSNPPFGVSRIGGFVVNLFKFEIGSIPDNG